MIEWLRGWYATIQMYVFDRETYNWLVNYEFDESDLAPVDRPREN